VKVNTGFVLTVMRDRGVAYDSNERIRDALKDMGEDHKLALHAALDAIRRGTDTSPQFERLASLAKCTLQSVVATVERCDIEYSAANVYAWMLADATASAVLTRAGAGDQAAARTVRTKLGEPALRVQPPRDVLRERGREQTVLPKPQAAKADIPRANRSGAADAAADLAAQGVRKHYAFGSKSALMFELDTVQGQEDDRRRHTLRVEAAKKLPGTDGKVDWDNKIIFQFTRKELALVAGGLLGLLPNLKFEGHGKDNDKWCEMQVQPGKLFVKVAQGARVIAVPIEGSDLYEIAVLGQRALVLNDPDLPASTLLETLKMTSALIATADQRGQTRTE